MSTVLAAGAGPGRAGSGSERLRRSERGGWERLRRWGKAEKSTRLREEAEGKGGRG